MAKKYVSDIVEVGDATDNVSIDKDGIHLKGNATVWEDINIDPTILTGSGSAPTLINMSGTTIPIASFRDNTTDEVGSCFEYPHKGLLNNVGETTVKAYMHFHYYPIGNTSGNAPFELEYLWTKNGSVIGTSTTISVIVPVLANSNWLPSVIEFPAITAPDSLGQQFHFRFARLGSAAGNTFNADIAISTIGFHYRIDSEGSKEKTVK